MKLFRTSQLMLLTVLTLAVATPGSASAWNPFGGLRCNDGGQGSAVCEDQGKTTNPLTGPDGLILQVADILAFAAGVIAIIIIILAGLRFVTANGSSEDIAAARRTLIYAVVGLVVIVLSRALVGFVIGRL